MALASLDWESEKTAQPVGRIERLRKWVKRPSTLVVLLAVVVLGGGLVAGLVVRSAQRTSRLETEKREYTEDALAESLGESLREVPGQQAGLPNSSERNALWRLAVSDNPRLRYRFFELALAHPDSAARLGGRAEWAVQAGVGLDARRRQDVLDLVNLRLRSADDLVIRQACVDLGLALAARDEAFTEAAAQVLEEALARTSDSPLLQRQAGRVLLLSEQLGEEQAAGLLPRLLDAMTRTTAPTALGMLARAVEKLAERLSPEASARALRQVREELTRSSNPQALPSLTQVLIHLAEQQPGKAEAGLPAGAHAGVREAREAIAGAEQDLLKALDQATAPIDLGALAEALGKLAKKLPAESADRAARKVQEALARTADPYARAFLAQALGKLAEQGSPESAARSLRKVLELLPGSADSSALPALTEVLVRLADRLPPEQAEQAAERIQNSLARAKDSQALPFQAQALGLLADRLSPEQAAQAMQHVQESILRNRGTPLAVLPLAEALAGLAERLPADQVLDELSRTPYPLVRYSLARALGKKSDQLTAAQAIQATRTILQALTKVGDLMVLASLADTLEKLVQRLPAEQSEPTARQILEVMEKHTGAHNSFLLLPLARALATLAARLPTAESAELTGEAAGTILDALSGKVSSDSPRSLSQALKALGEALPAPQRSKVIQAILDTMSREHVLSLPELAQAVGDLAERLPPEEARKTSDRLVEIMARPDSSFALPALAEGIRKLARHLPAEAAAELCARASQPLLDALPRTSDPGQLGCQAQALGLLAERLAPEQARQATRQVRHALTRTLTPDALPYLAQALGNLAERLPPNEARQATETVLELMRRCTEPLGPSLPQSGGRETAPSWRKSDPATWTGPQTVQEPFPGGPRFLNPLTLAPLGQTVAKLADRLPPEQAAEVTARALRMILEAMTHQSAPQLAEQGWSAQIQSHLEALSTRALLETTSSLAGQPSLASLEQAVEQLAERLRPEQAGKVLRPLLEVLTRSHDDPFPRQALARALGNFVERFSTQGVVDLLKHPLAVGPLRAAARRELAHRLAPPTPQASARLVGAIALLPAGSFGAFAQGMVESEAFFPEERAPFTDLWDTVTWLRQHHPELDLDSLPRRSDR